MPLSIGDKLGPYEILAPIGKGGMGEVYRAGDIRLKREVALKILPRSLAHDLARRQRFEQEARAPLECLMDWSQIRIETRTVPKRLDHRLTKNLP